VPRTQRLGGAAGAIRLRSVRKLSAKRDSTRPGAVVGAKPTDCCSWPFALLDAMRGDTLEDLYPGSRIVTWAWRRYTGQDHERWQPGVRRTGQQAGCGGVFNE
jgi:hypothetical protein